MKSPIACVFVYDSVDAFGDLFRGVRPQGSLFGSSTLTAPWSLRFVDGAPLTLCTLPGGRDGCSPTGTRPSTSPPATP